MNADAKRLMESQVIAVVLGDEVDLVQALEIGVAVLMGKPLLVVIPPDTRLNVDVKNKIYSVADEMIWTDVDTEHGRAMVERALSRLVA